MVEPTLIKIAADLVAQFIRSRPPSEKQAVADIPSHLQRHLRMALKWSSAIQFYGMARAEATDAATIPLRLLPEPRRFRTSSQAPQKTEMDLLNDDHHYLLVGDPGAGKTTTIKRLVRRLLLAEPESPGDTYEVPLVVRLRELDASASVLSHIAEEFGITYERRAPFDQKTRDLGLWVGGVRLERVIGDFLDSLHAVLLLDGLDEVELSSRDRLLAEIHALALAASEFKIIVSCRTGDYVRAWEGFDIVEVSPLDSNEIEAIAAEWLTDVGPFIAQLAKLPYHDVVDRPLLLTQLLFIFRRYGYLPEQPCEVYRSIVSLLIQEWDAERGIRRETKYSGFTSGRKLSFLAALAYHLTYRLKRKTFSSGDLCAAYLEIHEMLDLPRDEARQVVAEVEAHTGLISLAGPDAFEFSHLSLQEYLCAEYLVKEPVAEFLHAYLREYAGPIAVAVALSSNASAAFAKLFLAQEEDVPVSGEFLRRILLERPMFARHVALGMSVLKLYKMNYQDDAIVQWLDRFVDQPTVRASVSAALDYFDLDRQRYAFNAGYAQLTRRRKLDDPRRFLTPRMGFVPLALLKTLSAAGEARAQELLAGCATGVPGA